MKISYIIMPFENAEYLIRCVNSLYRQLGNDYEIILAENVLDEGSRDFLDEKPWVKRISEAPKSTEAKLSEAAELISDNSDYVQLLDVNTVVSPVMAKAVLACDKSDLIVPAAAIKEGDDFSVDMPDLQALVKNYDKYAPWRFCFGRELSAVFLKDVIENGSLFSLFLLSALAENRVVNFINDVCMYADGFAPPVYPADEIETVKKHCDAFWKILPGVPSVEGQIEILDDCIAKLSNFLAHEDFDVRSKAFHSLQDICRKIKENFLFRSFFEGKIGCKADDFLQLNYEEYTVYKLHVSGEENPVSSVDYAVQSRLLMDTKAAVDSVKRDLLELKRNVSEIKAKPMPAVALQGKGGLENPAAEVPQMYRDGRLGLKTIWKSFRGWLQYKVRGK